MNEIEKRFAVIYEAEADERDLAAIKEIMKQNDTSEGITLEQMDKLRAEQECGGTILLTVPRTLYRNLMQDAEDEGVSLNQYILYKLTK